MLPFLIVATRSATLGFRDMLHPRKLAHRSSLRCQIRGLQIFGSDRNQNGTRNTPRKRGGETVIWRHVMGSAAKLYKLLFNNKKTPFRGFQNGAGEETRTLDVHLGKALSRFS
jgi:hypothetical protein